jgi:hypothetical protein
MLSPIESSFRLRRTEEAEKEEGVEETLLPLHDAL